MSASTSGTVLVVDDDPYSVQPIIDALSDAGYRVTLSELSDSFFDTLYESEFDIILLDIMMSPNGFFSELEAHGGFVTGQLLAREIRDRFPDQKIIAFSLHRDAGLQEWFNNQEGMVFLGKGATHPEVVTQIVGKLIRNEGEGWAIDGNAVLDSIQLRPSIFGVGIDLKKAWKSVKKR